MEFLIQMEYNLSMKLKYFEGGLETEIRFDSEPVPDSALCPTLPCFYIHSIYIIPFIPNLDPAFSQKFKSGSRSEKCSRTPDPLRIRLCAHLCFNTK